MKYTFEIMKEYEDAFKGISVYSVSEDKKLMVDFVAREELEDAQKQVDEAYLRGLEEGKKATWGLVADASSDEYQRGLDAAWEAARKIIRMPEGNILDLFPDCYASVCTAVQAILKYDTSEAIAKLKAYEDQKADDSIKVGDEVRDDNGDTYIITCLNDDGTFDALYPDGTAFSRADMSIIYELTGRHFDIDRILEEMKE